MMNYRLRKVNYCLRLKLKFLNYEIVIKNSHYLCSYFNHLFESLYIFLRIGVLHPTQRMNQKRGKKLTINDVPFKNDNLHVLSFLRLANTRSNTKELRILVFSSPFFSSDIMD